MILWPLGASPGEKADWTMSKKEEKNVEQEDVGRMMFKVERKQGEQKEKLRNGHERRRKGFLRKGKGRQSGKELQKLLEPLGPLFLIFFFLACLLFRSQSRRKCRA